MENKYRYFSTQCCTCETQNTTFYKTGAAISDSEFASFIKQLKDKQTINIFCSTCLCDKAQKYLSSSQDR